MPFFSDIVEVLKIFEMDNRTTSNMKSMYSQFISRGVANTNFINPAERSEEQIFRASSRY